MNKKELVERISKEAALTQKDSEKFLNSFMKITSEKLAEGEEIRLVGFGTFKVVEKKERKGVNPKTLKPINIPAHKAPKFVPGKDLKEIVNK